jgi:hypothetical protein
MLSNIKEWQKVRDFPDVVDAKLSRLEMPGSIESVEMCKGSIGDS